MSSPKMEKAREGWLELLRQVSAVVKELDENPTLTREQRSHVAAITTLLSEYEERIAGAKTEIEVRLVNRAMAKVIDDTLRLLKHELDDKD